MPHFLGLSGRLLKRAAAVSWKVPFSRATCNFMEPKEPKHLHTGTLCKFKYKGHCLAWSALKVNLSKYYSPFPFQLGASSALTSPILCVRLHKKHLAMSLTWSFHFRFSWNFAPSSLVSLTLSSWRFEISNLWFSSLRPTKLAIWLVDNSIDLHVVSTD